MTELKCPFCQQELEIGGVDGILRGCPKCRNLGTEMLWQELIDSMKEYDLCHDALVERTKELDRTRKALNFAISTLTVISQGCVIEHSVVGHEDDNKIKLAKIALDRIKTITKGGDNE